jgi:hypothetical protein
MQALNRKQVPVCKACHMRIHRGDYDGLSLKDLAYDLRKVRMLADIPIAMLVKSDCSKKKDDAPSDNAGQGLKEFPRADAQRLSLASGKS